MSDTKSNQAKLAAAFQSPKFNFGLTKSLNLVQQRRTVSYRSNRTEYAAGETVILPFGSTTEFIYAPNSYVKMTVNFIASANNARVGTGSGLNIIDEMTLTAKSGIQIEHLRDVSTLAHIRDSYTCGDSYLQHTGTIMGYTGAGGDEKQLEGGFDICIPLHHISGFLGVDRYLPMSVLGGLELQLKLNDANFAVFDEADGKNNDYTVSNVELFTDSYRMTDAVLKYTDMLASGKIPGRNMMMMYDSFVWNRTSVLANTATSINLEKSFTKCMGAYSRIRTAANGVDEAKRDSVASATQAAVPLTSYQWRVGSEQHPSKPVTSQQQAYCEALKSFNNLANCVRTPFVDYAKYITTHGLIGVNLERDIDSTDWLSAVSTNNKNAISLEITLGQAAQVTTFLHHVRVLAVVDGALRIDQ